MIAQETGEWDVTFDVERPRYRVEFWERPAPDYAWNLEAWELSDCESVHEAIHWVDEHSSGRVHTLYAVLAPPETPHLAYLRLSGRDPNNP